MQLPAKREATNAFKILELAVFTHVPFSMGLRAGNESDELYWCSWLLG